MTRTCLVAGLVLLPAIAWAQDGGRQQYISDDISITVRDGPRNDAASVGVVNSGDRVTVLETLGEQSFARIRTSDGRSGWITSRYLSALPAAKDRVQGLQTELTQSRNQVKSLQAELDAAQARLQDARPAMEVAADNERLKAELATAQQQNQDAQIRTNEERARRRTLVTGAALVGGGILLGLILPLIGRSGGRRKRRNEL
jgi:SH3 domain protein